MKLEVLYFGGCPNYERLLPTLRELAIERGILLERRLVQSVEDAELERFLGSPSVRVNGLDIEPGANGRTDFGLKCRVYREAGRQSGVPPRDWIERALGPNPRVEFARRLLHRGSSRTAQ